MAQVFFTEEAIRGICREPRSKGLGVIKLERGRSRGTFNVSAEMVIGAIWMYCGRPLSRVSFWGVVDAGAVGLAVSGTRPVLRVI